MAEPIQVTFIGGPEDMTRRVFKRIPPGRTFRVPVVSDADLAIAWAREVTVRIAEYHIHHWISHRHGGYYVAFYMGLKEN